MAGLRATTPEGSLEVRARLTVGGDGRRSVVRAKAGLEVIDLGAPIDVLWMRVPRQPGDAGETLGRVRAGKILVTINRDEYWQCAYVIPKGALEATRKRGLEAFREDIALAAPFLKGRLDALTSWDDIKLLSVSVDRLRTWSRPGLVCIGDAAHAMSPVGGVGINLAIQDAVAAANILAGPLSQGLVTGEQLAQVQRRREFPTRVTQAFQIFAHRRVLVPTISGAAPLRRLPLPLPLRLLQRFPMLRRIPARLIGLGVRPEHIRTPDVRSRAGALAV